MPKKNNRIIKNRGYKGFTTLGKLVSDSNIIKIDKQGEHYIVASPYIKREGIIFVSSDVKRSINRQFGVLKFAASDTRIAAEVEKLLKMNHRKGGIALVAPRALGSIDGGDDGVWPPFVPKDIKVCVKNIKIGGIKK